MDTVDSTIEELEQQLQQCINENNELEIKMEEAVQDSGKVACSNCDDTVILTYIKLIKI